MSWQERKDKPYEIKTGDGESYFPYWLNPQRSLEFNTAEFNFPGVEGTFVHRGNSKGRKLPIEIYFTGEFPRNRERTNLVDHLDESELFEKSARDPRPWTIDHPYYGLILVQPISLTFDNKEDNVTKITGTVVETIDSSPVAQVDPFDNSRFLKTQLDEFAERSFTTAIPVPDIEVKARLTENAVSSYNEGKKLVKNSVDAQDYLNLFNRANTAIVNATAAPLEAIRQTQALINAPFQFLDSVKNRIFILRSQLNLLAQSVTTLLTKEDKKVYENNGLVNVSAMTQAAIVNPDYSNRVEVFFIVDELTSAYESYLENLDYLQSGNGGSVESYIPDFTSLQYLSNLVNYVVSNLLVISLTAKQERIIILEDDTNLILLAHRLYGLEADDSSIQRLINDNTIGLNEFLMIKKGRKITYYI